MSTFKEKKYIEKEDLREKKIRKFMVVLRTWC